MRILKTLGWTAITCGLLIPLYSYGRSLWQRPPQTPYDQQLFAGISYRREVFHQPRPFVVHIARIDLTAPGINLIATPGQPAKDGNEFHAQTTSGFLHKYQLQFAINAGYFYHFHEKTPWDYSPHIGDRVNVLGQAIANGQQYSPRQPTWPVLCFDASKRGSIVEKGHCPAGTLHAVAGNYVLSPHQPLRLDHDKPYPRTVAALDLSGKTLWLILVDGKQPHYSEGARLADIEKILQNIGADVALNLDGGGSATMAASSPSGVKVLNAPIQGKWPMQERPVATHLGFYAQPVGHIVQLNQKQHQPAP